MKIIFFILSALFFSISLFVNNLGQEIIGVDNNEIKTKHAVKKDVTQSTGQTITFKDDEDYPLIIVTDEGNAGSITLHPLSTIGTSTNKLYNIGNSLFWNGSAVGTSVTATGWTNEGTTVRLTDTDDKVGIGTNNPGSKLHLFSSTSSYGMFRIENALEGANEASIGFKMGSDATGTDTWIIGVGPWGNDSDFVIGRASPKVLLNPAGNLGIAKTNPECKLDVNGNSRISTNSSIHDIYPSALTVNNTGDGYGITSTASANYGIHGESTSNNGEGVRGTASNLTGNNYGGYFEASGDGGTGVYGKATNSVAATTYGGYFESEGTTGIGVHGTGNGGAGVEGISMTGYGGIFGSNNDHLDVMLKGPIGRINTDPNYQNSDLILSGNNDVIVRLDNDGGEDGVFRVKKSDGVDICKVTETGRLTAGELELTGGSDLSERFEINYQSSIIIPKPGMLVSIDPENEGMLTISNSSYDKKLAGIISGAGGIKTGLLMGQLETIADGEYPVALTGRVYCLANTLNGVIEPGDMLTSSDIPGYAMKASDASRTHGAIIGKAMSSLKYEDGLVLVLVTLQ